jgi:hypothetical protein
VAHAQFPSPPSITLHLGDGFTNQYNDESPDNAILGQPMSGNITISGLSGNETARVQCYVNNYGLIYSETVSYNAYSTFTWTPSYLGATTAGCSLSVQSSTSQQYVLTENMPMTVFDKTPQVAIPQYKVLSLIYAAPGNSSSAGLTSGTTNGTSTSLGTNFSSGTSVTFSYKFVVASVSATFGVTDTNGQTNQTTDTFSNATGISNISNHTGPNTLNHNQDLFLLWLNPVVTVQQTSPTAIQYTYSLPSSANGVMDTVEVTAEAMEANAQGATTVPLAILLPQTYGSQTVPGVANICAHPLPANQCTQANQCGCVPSDFTTILAQDPLLQFSSTESPLQADAGGSTCGDLSANPTYADCRYVPVPESSQSPYQEILLLSGPDCSGCNSSGNSYVVTDATQKTLTYSGSSSATVGVSGSAGALGPTVSASHQWTWTDSESIGAINGNNSVMNVTLSSSTVGCDQNIPVFEDTVYHTFVFQQPADNTSCP